MREISREKKQCWFHLFVLFFVTLSAQIFFLQPPILSDQLNYFFHASNFPLMAQFPDHQVLRLGLIIPLHFLIEIFGYSEFSYYLIPILSEILLVIFTYLLGRRILHSNLAFWGAFIIPFFPYIIRYSGYLLPDSPSAALFMLPILILFFWKDKYQTTSTLFNVLLFIALGLLLGWSYLTREFILIFFPLIFLFFLLFKIPKKYLLFIGGGFFIILLLEASFNSMIYHNALIRLLASQPRVTVGNIQKDVVRILTTFPDSLLKYSGFGFFLLIPFSLISTIEALIQKKMDRLFLALWLFGVYVCLTIIGLLPVLFHWEDRVLLRLNLFRYWLIIVPPLALLGIDGLVIISHKITQFLHTKKSKITMLPAYIFILITISLSLSSAYGESRFIRWGNDHYLEFREFLKNDCISETIWLDRENFRSLNKVIPMYLNNFLGKKICQYEVKYINNRNEYIDVVNITEGLIPIHTVYMNSSNFDVPDYLTQPPVNWLRIFESENGVLYLYRIGARN